MLVRAWIKPNSRKGPLVRMTEDGMMELFVREPAVEGKANAAAVALLAEYYGVPRHAVRLVGGAASRNKRFEVDIE